MIQKIYNLLPANFFLKKIYRFIKSRYYAMRENGFMNVSLSQVKHINCQPQSEFLLISVAFNNPIVVAQQIRLLRKYVLDSFQCIIVDNSSVKSIRHEIFSLCKKNNTGYVSLPHNFYSKSNSHGLALNWAYHHLVKSIKPAYFGFLDHDIYPVREHRIVPILRKQFFYGKKEEVESIWYLWPGFFFAQTSLLDSVNPDFKPGAFQGTQLDTGGLLYSSLFKNTDVSNYQFPATLFQQLREGNDISSDMLEYFFIEGEQSWVHTANGGYWKKALPKEQLIESLLSQY